MAKDMYEKRREFEDVSRHLPEDVRPLVMAGFDAGWAAAHATIVRGE